MFMSCLLFIMFLSMLGSSMKLVNLFVKLCTLWCRIFRLYELDFRFVSPLTSVMLYFLQRAGHKQSVRRYFT